MGQPPVRSPRHHDGSSPPATLSTTGRPAASSPSPVDGDQKSQANRSNPVTSSNIAASCSRRSSSSIAATAMTSGATNLAGSGYCNDVRVSFVTAVAAAVPPGARTLPPPDTAQPHSPPPPLRPARRLRRCAPPAATLPHVARSRHHCREWTKRDDEGIEERKRERG
ncbi:Os09g0464100 [Oryza sativa Japonica Group]|uniref:Os09g0464100 protein n=1 Tax=Oryza sativa subsp. japonica TaxID=39947 RepID=Q69MC6_ORYSJ|nr:unknown protein [Oryza sativa Japonica Group]BAF25324.1 Os09g0464100 [Oryza sativa Japonica Group]|eukprot:NP_001063410.1 Os09g0464100 [Oryza sativa Japonica Group]